MALLNTLPLSTAFQRGHQHWKARISQWGNDGTGEDATSLGYTVDRPIIGAQIASDSDVGECLIMFDAGFGFPIESPYTIVDDNLYIRRGRPYFWRTPSEVRIFPTWETRYDDTFLPVTASQAATFGGGLANWDDWAPELRIILFFDVGPLPVAEPAYPQIGINSRRITTISATEVFDGRCVFPVQHRENLVIQAHTDGLTDIAYEFRVCGVNGTQADGTAGAPDGLREFSMLSTPLVSPGQPAGIAQYRMMSFPIKNQHATWLTVYPSSQLGLNGALDLRVLAD